MGKPITQALGDVELVASIYEYYAHNAATFLADEARSVAPNIALGNTIILEHARNCPQSALAIERVLRDAVLPADAHVNAADPEGPATFLGPLSSAARR